MEAATTSIHNSEEIVMVGERKVVSAVATASPGGHDEA